MQNKMPVLMVTICPTQLVHPGIAQTQYTQQPQCVKMASDSTQGKHLYNCLYDRKQRKQTKDVGGYHEDTTAWKIRRTRKLNKDHKDRWKRTCMKQKGTLLWQIFKMLATPACSYGSSDLLTSSFVLSNVSYIVQSKQRRCYPVHHRVSLCFCSPTTFIIIIIINKIYIFIYFTMETATNGQNDFHAVLLTILACKTLASSKFTDQLAHLSSLL